MKRFLAVFIICLAEAVLLVSCAKKSLTLGNETPMKTLLKASDKEITDLVVREANAKAGVAEENVSVEYILRDAESQAIAVKIKIDKE